MNKRFLIVSFLLFTFIGFAQKVQSDAYGKMLETLLTHEVNEITVKETIKLSSVQFVDAREIEEYNVSHIKNATWCGYNTFSFDRLKTLDAKKKTVVYCSVGYRSEQIAIKLKKLGLSHVYNLYGGIFEWVNQGNPVYDNAGNQTQQVHAYDQAWSQWLTKGEKVY